ncbi:hypothetical protein PY093_10470 [Cytobacillus sp. S13-E01]|uniref:hypothetical protein n=1 Tax=Cytobacillus sp. S13-E01 TaxID=3031326 RepID=UPI0023D8BC21|nr:hypothetical protein [Cytobacillus sp. S13-E01]MDF0727137.1 hypothetical protein [Cytobacillus sp. S13-E01]
MKKMKLDELSNSIDSKRKSVNEKIININNRSSERKKRSRKRSHGEREALDQISISRWKKAIEKGTVRKISDRIWYYDY